MNKNISLNFSTLKYPLSNIKKGKVFKIIYIIRKIENTQKKMYKASSFHEYTNPRTFFQNFLAHYTMPLTTKV